MSDPQPEPQSPSAGAVGPSDAGGAGRPAGAGSGAKPEEIDTAELGAGWRRKRGGRWGKAVDPGVWLPKADGLFALAWYVLVRRVVVGFCRVWWRMSVEGLDNVPLAGPFILAPVHRSNVDSMVVAVCTRRRLRYMGKDSMWKYRWSSWFFTSLGGFPVRRGMADREALRTVTAVLATGEPVVMFPEGTRQSGPVVEKFYDGPAYVASRSQVPIVPVGIGGSERAMRKGSPMVWPVKIHVEIGRPLHPAKPGPSGRVSRRGVADLSERLRVAIQDLFDLAQVRAGA